jgi:hypothetical protein
MAFPTFEKIQSWSDEKLLSVIYSGEQLNWDIRFGETREELDEYMIDLFNEKDFRGL